jgi:hypothetical protein
LSSFEDCDPTPGAAAIEAERLVEIILREQRKKAFAAVQSLWRIGDAVRRLKGRLDDEPWRDVLDTCAKRVEMHTSSLEEAARAAEAFPRRLRVDLRETFERARVELTASHVVVLARVTPKQRKQGIDALLNKRYSVRELRAHLRRRFL